MTTASRNYNDPREHVHLAKLLDRPEALAAETRTRVLIQLRESLDLALALPEGDARINLLGTLNTALGDALRYHQYYGESQVLQAQLKATHPVAAEIRCEVGILQNSLRALHAKAKEAEELDAANGTDVNRSAWFWFRHELYGLTDHMAHRLRTLERSAGVPIQPAPDDTD
jgi:hypothetical protein